MEDAYYVVEKRYPESPLGEWEPCFERSSASEVSRFLRDIREVVPAGTFEYRILVTKVLEQDVI